MIDNYLIDFYAFIQHLAEEDERKEHIHLFIVPSSLVETNAIIERFKEFDKNNPDKPLGCIACRSSKFGDWYMYALHDKHYLLSKGQSRQFYYLPSDFIVSDDVYFREEIHQIDKSKFIGLDRLSMAIEDGLSFNELVANGQIPVQLISQYRFAYDCMCAHRTNRFDRVSHSPKESTEE